MGCRLRVEGCRGRPGWMEGCLGRICRVVGCRGSLDSWRVRIGWGFRGCRGCRGRLDWVEGRLCWLEGCRGCRGRLDWLECWRGWVEGRMDMVGRVVYGMDGVGPRSTGRGDRFPAEHSPHVPGQDMGEVGDQEPTN